jgi:hypothetical protein
MPSEIGRTRMSMIGYKTCVEKWALLRASCTRSQFGLLAPTTALPGQGPHVVLLGVEQRTPVLSLLSISNPILNHYQQVPDQ